MPSTSSWQQRGVSRAGQRVEGARFRTAADEAAAKARRMAVGCILADDI